MRLLRDEQAYRQILDDFASRRLGAGDFIERFERLWDGDRAEGVGDVLARQGAPAGPAGLYGLLDSIATLCAAYVRCLPEGCGYRVSEEQLHKEIEAMVSAWPAPPPSDGACVTAIRIA